MLGLIGLVVANQSSLQWKITMQERHLCWPTYFFLAPQCPHFFHSRIVTVTPVSHPFTRLIHISPSCWTIYRSFEIILEMGTVHWIELQIQCFIQIHCFKNTQSDMNYENLQHDHCSSICNALMMITGVIETFAICRLYRSHWPWFSL